MSVTPDVVGLKLTPPWISMRQVLQPACARLVSLLHDRSISARRLRESNATKIPLRGRINGNQSWLTIVRQLDVIDVPRRPEAANVVPRPHDSQHGSVETSNMAKQKTSALASAHGQS